MTLRGNTLVILVASIAAIAGILFGYDTGVISGAILYINDEFELTSWINGFVVSSVLFGALLGSAVGGRFADYFGRRKLLIVTALVFLVGTLETALAFSVPILILGRVIVGIAIGVASFATPLYISEIAPAEYRGALVSLNQLAITVGIVLSYTVDAYFAKHGGDWRFMLGSGIIPAVILFFGMFFLPKSPRWLIYKGKRDEACVILQRIRGRDNVSHELEEIEESIQRRTNWHLLLQKWLRPALFIGLGLAFFQQCTGINTIIYYAPTIFEMAGFRSAVVAIFATLGVGLANVLFTIITLPLIDKWGRRPLLLTGLTAMTLGLMGLGAAFYFGDQLEFLRWIALFSMVFYIAGFAMGLGPIMWLMLSEIYPLEIRGLGSSLAASTCWGFNMLVTLTFLAMTEFFGTSGTFLIYTLMCIIGLMFVAIFVPETKGVHLEQIERNLRAGVKAKDLGQRTP